MDASLVTPHELVRPWKRATILASAIAAVELALLIGVGGMLMAKPLSRAIRDHAAKVATAPPKRLHQAVHRMHVPLGKARPRSRVTIMVFNGNGHQGAAGTEAHRLLGLGYKVSGTTNARRQDYATSVVMYRPGFRAEGLRLAKDLGVEVVGPLDGIRVSALEGGQIAVIVGA